MKPERRIPAWLLRDLPALVGLLAQLWLFVWPLIQEGFRLMRGEKLRAGVTDRLADLLLNAEATLAFALWREAYRRLGYNPRRVRLEIADLPASQAELLDRIQSYLSQVQNLSRAAAFYTEQLRRQVGAASHSAKGATHVQPRRAARRAPVSVSASSSRTSQLALVLSNAQSARPTEAARVLAHARGPPLIPIMRNRACSTPARPRDWEREAAPRARPS